MLCIKDEIVIKFKKNALNLDQLCYSYPGPPSPVDPGDIFRQRREEMMSQRFSVDTLVADSSLKERIKFYGGQYLRRITWADPCRDTISITRYGDTTKVENYLWMTIELDNETSSFAASLDLTISFQDLVHLAEPNYCGQVNDAPNDSYFHGDYYSGRWFEQKSLKYLNSNVERAWDFQRGGSKDVKIGVIDEGADYLHCDLGGGLGDHFKIKKGYSFPTNNDRIAFYSNHGTAMTGIIGGLSNGFFGYCINGNGIAGIAGGWYTEPEWTTDKFGCGIYILKISDYGKKIPLDHALGGVIGAASKNPEDEVFFGCHVINCSWDFNPVSDDVDTYLLSLHEVINFAFEQGVSIVTSRGNKRGINVQHPACYDPSWITSVGGHDTWDEEVGIVGRSDLSFGHYMDFVAPSHPDDIITVGLNDGYQQEGYTSAAAAHVTGAIGLLRSYFVENEFKNIEACT